MTNKTDRLLTEREREATAAYEIGFKDGQKIGRAARDKEWQEKLRTFADKQRTGHIDLELYNQMRQEIEALLEAMK